MEDNQSSRPSIFKRKYIIIPDFQTALITHTTLIIILYYIGSYLVEYFVLKDVYNSPEYALMTPELIFTTIKSKLVILSTIKFFIVLILLLGWGIWFSHRAAGPIYRAQKVFQELNKGLKPSTVEIRKKDYFQELFQEIREFLLKN